MRIYYLLKSENYRIAFITPKTWKQKPYCYKLKAWFFSYLTYWPNTRTEIFQFYFFGLGFGYKKNW